MRFFKLKTTRLALVFSVVMLIVHLGIGYLLAAVIKDQMLAGIWQRSLKIYWPAMDLIQILRLNVNVGVLMGVGVMILAALLELWVIFSVGIWLVRLYFRKPPISNVSKMAIPVIVLVVAVCFYKASPAALGDSRSPLERAIEMGDTQVVEKILQSNPSLANKRIRPDDTPLNLAIRCQHPQETIEILLKYGADINATGWPFDETPLQAAAGEGKFEAVKALLAHHPDVNAIQGQSPGRTALNFAVNYYENNSSITNLEMVNLLLASGADINHGYPVLFDCENRPDLMEYLLERGASPNVQDLDGDTPLHRAIIFGGTNRIAILLRFHPDLKLKDGNYGTPLATALEMNRLDIALMIQNYALQSRSNTVDFAASQGNLEELSNLLQKNPQSIEEKDELGFTPLDWAAEAGQTNAADLLLSHGADVNARDQVNLNPLDWAAFSGHLSLVEMLVTNGANDLGTALFLSVQQQQNSVAKFLLEHGADPNARYRFSNTTTVLHLAAGQGNIEAARLLLEHGAQVNAIEQNGSTPLEYAASQTSKEMVEFLFEHGAIIPEKKAGYWSIFHEWALGAGDPNIADLLLSHKADINARTSDGQTPLHFAAQQGQLQAVEWLLKHGADVNARDNKGVTPLSLTKIRNRGREVEKRKDIADLLRKFGAKE